MTGVYMGNTYTQIHIHAVFAVQNRLSLINNRWEENLNKYITGIIDNIGHKTLQIGGMSDHIHILIGMKPTQSVSDMMKDIKGSSSSWINKNGYAMGKFQWQEGYGAFSCSKSVVQNVINYIQNQKKHHTKSTFQSEYLKMLKRAGIDYEEEYILKSPV